MTEHKYGSGELISIDLYCPECNTRSWDTVPKTEASYETRWDCPDCGTVASLKRIPSAPRVAKASFPDGYKRAGFQDLKEAAKLEIEKSSYRPEERGKIVSEINRLEQRNPK